MGGGFVCGGLELEKDGACGVEERAAIAVSTLSD